MGSSPTSRSAHNTVVSPTTAKRYIYQRYMFMNAAAAITAMFTSTCELIGVRWTRTVVVSRREDVAFLDSFITPKS